jgi:predicted porin
LRSKLQTRPVLAALSLAASVACIPTQAHAQSSVRFYGMLDVYGGTVRPSGKPNTDVINGGGMQTSYFGFAGEEDLGNGTSAIFALDGYFLPDTGTMGAFVGDSLFSRYAYAGFKGKWGEFKAGRLTSEIFFPSVRANPFGSSYKFSPLMAQMYIAGYGQKLFGGGNWDNALEYTSPVVNGFQADVYGTLHELPHASTFANYGGWLTYSSGPLSLTASAQKVLVGPGISASEPGQKLGFVAGTYDFGPAKFYASYGKFENVSGKRTGMPQLGVSIKAGSGNILASVVKSNANFVGGDRTSMAVGYDCFLSKRTDLYVAFLTDKLPSASRGNSFGVGMRTRF